MMKTLEQLSHSFLPTNYRLKIDLTKARDKQFSGLVEITGDLVKPADTITLHSKDLVIDSILLNGQPAEFSHGQFDELTIGSTKPLTGQQSITIAYHAKLTDQMHGIYPCYYQHQGQTKELYATQFESHHAREAFPCIDEPAAKASFDIVLITEPGLTTLGNMPIASQDNGETATTTIFETTPVMSSYLLAFVVGDLHKKSAKTKRGIETNVWAAAHQDPKTLDFALDIATRTIDFFEEYFGVDYPLPKADHVALPDFSSGAMENWGLITYRESCLLYDPQQTTESAKRSTATVITHELSHQWFGNLVTMRWWNDLWLNESFANIMEYIAVDALEPSWNIWEDYATSEVVAAMRRDSIDGVQPVKVEVNHPDEISAIFDPAIVYAKGGRLLKMVIELVGESAFRRGLKAYFEEFAYRNTKGDDLWQAIETASGQPIVKLMNQWISQPGLPLVRVEESASQLTISQSRFFIGQHQPDSSLWTIPLFSNDQQISQLDGQKADFPANSQLLINQGLSGHFVTSYSHRLRQNLLIKIADGQLSTLDKICLLQDSSLLSRSGQLPPADLLPLAMQFSRETNEKVFDMAAMLLHELRKFVETEPLAKLQLKSISASFAKNSFELLGWDEVPGESDDDRERRTTAIALTLYSEQPDALAEAKRRFDQGIDSLSPEIRSIVFSSVVRHFEADEIIKQLLELYRQTSSTDLQIDICIGLTASASPATIDRLLTNLKDPQIIRPQDVNRWFAYLIRNDKARDQTWQWLKSNWSWIEDSFKGDKSYDNFPRYATAGLSSRAMLQEYREFFEPKTIEHGLTRVIQMGIQEITGRVELIEKYQPSVVEALGKLSE